MPVENPWRRSGNTLPIRTGGIVVPSEDSSPTSPAIGSDTPPFSVIKVALDTATTGQLLSVAGNFVWVIQASDVTAEVDIQFNTQTGDEFPFTQGAALGVWPFQKLYLNWSAQPGKWVKLAISKSRPGAQLLFLNPAIAVNNVSLTGNNNGVVERPGTLKSFADVAVANATQVLILAADATRRRAQLVNTGANAIRIGDSNTGATQGALIQSMGSITMMGDYAVYAYGSGGASSVGGVTEND